MAPRAQTREPEAAGRAAGPALNGRAGAQDVARVARWMAGKAVGLVLSGGGSRSLAHLGVLHALDDAGLPIDVIGGTSQARRRAPQRACSTGGPCSQARPPAPPAARRPPCACAPISPASRRRPRL